MIFHKFHYCHQVIEIGLNPASGLLCSVTVGEGGNTSSKSKLKISSLFPLKKLIGERVNPSWKLVMELIGLNVSQIVFLWSVMNRML